MLRKKECNKMTYSDINIENKLKDCFDEMIVYKDLQKYEI